MSQNGNPDEVQPRREEALSLPLARRETDLPASYESAHPLLPAERVELPLGVTLPDRREAEVHYDKGTQPRFHKSTRRQAVEEPEDPTEPRFYKSTKPEAALRRREDDEEPETRPRLLEREAAKQPTADSHGDGSNDGSPPPNDYQPPQPENPPTTTSRSNAHGSVFVDTEKLSQAIPGLDQIMRRMFAIGNSTANALAGYQLDRGDSYGEAWTKNADPISAQILEGLSNAGTVFGDTAEGAHLMVHNYNVTEENAIDSAGGLFSREK